MSDAPVRVDEFVIVPIGPHQSDAAYALMKELRPHLSYAMFLERRTWAAHQSYLLYGAFVADRLIGLIGWRTIVDMLHGRHLYIDDLVVAEAARSRGIGRALLGFAEDVAAREGCLGLRLCTGIDHDRGRQFYQREGWIPKAVAFKKGFPI